MKENKNKKQMRKRKNKKSFKNAHLLQTKILKGQRVNYLNIWHIMELKIKKRMNINRLRIKTIFNSVLLNHKYCNIQKLILK